MIKYLLMVALAALSFSALAQDPTAYELQRNKVNALLSQRSVKFGQYQKSLNSKTGIFGLQTKKDIKNSNEILRQITLHDNNIFRELKVLMDYKEMQVQQVQSTAQATTEKVERFTLAIDKLKERNAALNAQVVEQAANQKILYYVIAGLAALFLVTVIFFSLRLRALVAKNKRG